MARYIVREVGGRRYERARCEVRGTRYEVRGTKCFDRLSANGRSFSLQVGPALAAVDDDRGAGDPGGAWRANEGDDVRDLFGCAEAAHGDVLLNEAGDALWVFLLALPPGAAGVGDGAGSDRVHANVVRREIDRHRLGVADEGSLHSVVAGSAAGLAAVDGAEVDDAASAG